MEQTDEIDYPQNGFINKYEYYLSRRPSVTIVVERDVVDPILIRNSESDRAETTTWNGTTRAQSNPEKFTSKERLTGLDLLRQLDDKGDLINNDYRYNEPPEIGSAINMDTLTYGIAGTDAQEYGMKSRVTVGYTYTLGEYNVVDSEQRNAVYESGTMDDDEGEQSQALYKQVRVKPGNEFVHFYTLEAATPAMLLYTLHNILNTFGYGARETRSGKTVDNEIRALVVADQPIMLSVGEFIDDYDPNPQSDAIGEAVGEYLEAQRRCGWDVYGDDGVPQFDGFPAWFSETKAVAGRRREDALDVMREMFRSDTEEARGEQSNIPGIADGAD